MAANNIQTLILDAAAVPLLSPVYFKGVSRYMIGTNVLSCDDSNPYVLDKIAAQFGSISNREVNGQMRICCGDVSISMYDFGLLFSCFSAMVSAHAESGTAITALVSNTSAVGTVVLWFGNHCVIYNLADNLIIPVKSSMVQNACRWSKVEVNNFTDTRVYIMKREGFSLHIQSNSGASICSFEVPLHVQKAFPYLFDGDRSNDFLTDDPNTPWDERSGLGALITGTVNRSSAEEVVRRYSNNIVIDSVVVRDDLCCTPTTRYTSAQEFLGSICYTDSNLIALAVNLRSSLFVYRPWFMGDLVPDIEVTRAPQLSSFFNVTKECLHISRFADTVTLVPPTAAELDAAMFEKIKEAFYSMTLPRMTLRSAFGKLVIPEPVLLGALGTVAGESAYCVVPVGTIGPNIICKTSGGGLVAMTPPDWDCNSPLYDVTEVISKC